MRLTAKMPSLTAAPSIDIERRILALPVTLAAVDDDLDALNAGEAPRQVLVERDFLPRDDDQQHLNEMLPPPRPIRMVAETISRRGPGSPRVPVGWFENCLWELRMSSRLPILRRPRSHRRQPSFSFHASG